ncbi:MAG: hypothetical protein LBP79_01370 [Clostridiales bacterium]|jgi:hypothetical protein|nr:hypothetical protein [Clostridiales bacterium]
MDKFFKALTDLFAYVNPGYVFVIFSALTAAGFAASLITAFLENGAYIKAFKRASEYLGREQAGSLCKNNAGYFFKNYASDFPVAMQNRIAAYFISLDGKPSGFITESDCLKCPTLGARKRLALTLFDLLLFAAFAVSAALSLAYGGAETFGIAALIPFSAGIALRYVLKLASDASDRRLSDEFYILIYALDTAVISRENRSADGKENVVKRASALIEKLVDEEIESRKYYFINKTDGLSRELRGGRLREVAANVAVLCGEKTSAAALKEVFETLVQARVFYGTREETDVLSRCLVKLKNAIIRAEKESGDISLDGERDAA